MSEIDRFEVADLSGRDKIRLADHKGKVLLLVNTASRCGLTPQYAGLESLYRRYRESGLVVIGFPCDQFGHQEPGDAGEIAEFCQKNYGVTFLLSEKIEVNGPGAHPLWDYLQRRKRGILGMRRIKWNFTKFLVDRQGQVLDRFEPSTPPEQMVAGIERALQAS